MPVIFPHHPSTEGDWKHAQHYSKQIGIIGFNIVLVTFTVGGGTHSHNTG